MRWAILIPARYGSTRLPAKALLDRSGKYLVQHVHERALAAPGRPQVLVLTDDDRIADAVRSYGGEARMTRPEHASGTDRCAEAARTLDVEVVVNLQGDEPFVEPADLRRVAEAAAEPGVDLATLGHPFPDEGAMEGEHAVKAVVDAEGLAVDFTRSAARARQVVPVGGRILHHLGIYAFRRGRLLDFAAAPSTAREREERLEQLRAVERGWRIRVLVAARPAFGVDTPEDYERFLEALRAAGRTA